MTLLAVKPLLVWHMSPIASFRTNRKTCVMKLRDLNVCQKPNEVHDTPGIAK
jgi:hypothetical protein